MSLSQRCLFCAACTSALTIAAIANAADPAAPNTNAARQNRPEPKAAAAREARESPDRSEAAARTNRDPGHLDSELAACLIIGNQKEIAISRLAEQSQNSEVKKFAEQMIQDHEKFAGELQKFADRGGFESQQLAVDATAQAGRKPERTTTQGDRVRNAETTRSAGRSEALESQGNAHETINLEREIAEKCVQSAQREMQAQQGTEADQCYIGMQVGAHMYMVDKIEVFSRHASPELQAVLQQGLKTSQQHLEHAKRIHKELNSQSTRTGEQPSAREKQS